MSPRSPISVFPRLLSVVGLCIGAASCEKPSRIEVTASRKVFTDEGIPKMGSTTAQRYAANLAQSLLIWTTPEGWNFLPATEFRQINFDFGPKREGECYLTLLPVSSGGGMLENLNRWRKQMSLEALTQEQADALPTKQIFGRPVPMLDISGTYVAGSGPMMQAGAPRPDYRLMGLIFEAPGTLFTIKLTGPAALVAENLSKFDQFCNSLAPAPQHLPEDSPPAAKPMVKSPPQ